MQCRLMYRGFTKYFLVDLNGARPWSAPEGWSFIGMDGGFRAGRWCEA